MFDTLTTNADTPARLRSYGRERLLTHYHGAPSPLGASLWGSQQRRHLSLSDSPVHDCRMLDRWSRYPQANLRARCSKSRALSAAQPDNRGVRQSVGPGPSPFCGWPHNKFKQTGPNAGVSRTQNCSRDASASSQVPTARLTCTAGQRTIGSIASPNQVIIFLPASAGAGFLCATKTEGRNYPRAEE
jgi:hypothetical protein